MKRRLVLIAILLTAAACTTPYQKRGTEKELLPFPIGKLAGIDRENRIRQINLEARSIENFKETRIGIIELDDDGNINPAQRDVVLSMVRDELTKPDTLLVNFIHGWHHGARVCDRDLACFRRVLQELAAVNPNRRVVGVFLGWRGESCTVRGLNIATLFDRKLRAVAVGRTGAKETLIAIQLLYNKSRDHGSNPTMVSVGHSLGGAMLYEATKGKLTGSVGDIERRHGHGSYRIVRAEEDREIASAESRKALRAGFGDLVVLVNPALEAREYRPFAADLPDRKNPSSVDKLIDAKLPYDANARYSEGQLPIMMTVASEGDTAVGRIFPVAQLLSAIPLLRFYQFESSGWHGMGRYKPQVTHRLDYHGEKSSKVSRDPIASSCDCTKDYSGLAAELRNEEAKGLGTSGRLQLTNVESQTFGKLQFKLDDQRIGNWDSHTPYLVISASPSVISEHSDIFNRVFVGFLARYIRAIELSRPSAPPQPR